MVELNQRERTIKVKIVYYGPAVGGKTTNLQVLHQNAFSARRGEFVSVNSAQERTILFDLLPLRTQGFRGYELRLQILAVPGQAMYAATRRVSIKNADGVVFVANSAADRWQENVASFREMTENLLASQIDPTQVPLVLQYNKRDLPETTPLDFMDRTLNARKVPFFPAVAVRGEGTLETFSAILRLTMADLAARYQTIELARGHPVQQWTRETVLGMFGRETFAAPSPAPGAPAAHGAPAPPPPSAEAAEEERTLLRIALPEDTVRMASKGPDARANESLVETYAQASATLSAALAAMREKRDRANRQLEALSRVLGAAHDLGAGKPVELVLKSLIPQFAEAGEATYASFLLPTSPRLFRVVALHGLGEDPLALTHVGAHYLAERWLNETAPRWQDGAEALDLGQVLGSATPGFAGVTVVPVRTARGVQGLVLMYQTWDDARPTAETLAHLGAMAGALAPALELANTLRARAAEAPSELTLLGAAAERGLLVALQDLHRLRDHMGSLRFDSRLPPLWVDALQLLVPNLSAAMSTVNGLVGFGRGEVVRESVEIADLVATLPSEHVRLDVGPGVESVSGDPLLIRVALEALLESVRGPGRAVDVRIRAHDELVKVRASAAPSETGHEAEAPPAERVTVLRALASRVAHLCGGRLVQENDGERRPWTTLVFRVR